MFSQKRVFLMFWEMELSSPTIKNPLIFLQIKKLFFRKWNFLKNFLYFPKRGNFPDSENKKSTLKKFILFWEMELSSLKLKKLIYFLKKKISYISGGNFLSLKIKSLFLKCFFFRRTPKGFLPLFFFFFFEGEGFILGVFIFYHCFLGVFIVDCIFSSHKLFLP